MRVNWEGVKSLIGLAALVCFVWTIATAQKGPDFGEDPPAPPTERELLMERVHRMTTAVYGLQPVEGVVEREGEELYLVQGEDRTGIRGSRWQHFRSRRPDRAGEARPTIPMGSCDSDQECEAKTDEMCKGAGYSGVDKESVEIVKHADGSKNCSGECSGTSNRGTSGGVAFVDCSAPNTIIDDPDAVGRR